MSPRKIQNNNEHADPCSASLKYEPRHDKTNKMSVRPAKIQISLGIRPVWSESSLCAQWVAKDPSFLHADCEDSDQTGRPTHFVGFVMSRLILRFTPSFWKATFMSFNDLGQGYAVLLSLTDLRLASGYLPNTRPFLLCSVISWKQDPSVMLGNVIPDVSAYKSPYVAGGMSVSSGFPSRQ